MERSTSSKLVFLKQSVNRSCLLLTRTLELVSNTFSSYGSLPHLTVIDIDNPDALRKYYDLLLSVLRVIVSSVFVRGLHNEQMVERTRSFLAENRQCMVGIFKQFAKIGGAGVADHHETLGDLAKSFMALVTATDFLEVRSII